MMGSSSGRTGCETESRRVRIAERGETHKLCPSQSRCKKRNTSSAWLFMSVPRWYHTHTGSRQCAGVIRRCVETDQAKYGTAMHELTTWFMLLDSSVCSDLSPTVPLWARHTPHVSTRKTRRSDPQFTDQVRIPGFDSILG
eukprot:650561-Rhodomonas_salina.7